MKGKGEMRTFLLQSRRMRTQRIATQRTSMTQKRNEKDDERALEALDEYDSTFRATALTYIRMSRASLIFYASSTTTDDGRTNADSSELNISRAPSNLVTAPSFNNHQSTKDMKSLETVFRINKKAQNDIQSGGKIQPILDGLRSPERSDRRDSGRDSGIDSR